ncbi:MAG: DNA polymerase I [Legionellales bacterium]|jgi:DNA polymerase I|nr:DNA polymerase I [Legionellales bacterium]
MTKKLCVLVDGSSYLYRAYHAMPYLANDKQEPTGAIYGVINMLKSLIKQYPSDAMFGMIFDPKGPTVRHDIYPEYKANREAMPDELIQQVEPLYAIIKAMGIPLIIMPGQEADDVIGTITKTALTLDYDVVISTGDKDMTQLVTPEVELINTMTNKKLDVAGVKEKFGVYPKQIIDYLALIGDTSDNIPGVDKVGPKTAAKWLQEYDDIDNLLANIDALRGKVASNLAASIDTLALARKLVTIDQDIVIPDFNFEQLQRSAPDTAILASYYKQYGFKKYFEELNIETQPQLQPQPNTDNDYITILTQVEFSNLLNVLATSAVIAVDTETDSLNTRHANLVGISLAVKAKQGFYIPLKHNYEDCPLQLDLAAVISGLAPYLTADTKIIVGQNLKYDYKVLARHGLELGGQWYDTMLLSYVLNSSSGRHNLTALASRFLDVTVLEFEDVVGRGRDQVTFDKVDIPIATKYAAEDADIALRLYELIWPQLIANGLADVYLKIDAPLIKILAVMEQNGIFLDIASLKAQGKRLKLVIYEIEQAVHLLAGEEFNLASTKQLRHILFEKLGLPILKKTPNKQAATSEEVLKTLSSEHEIAAKLLEHRSLAKLQSTYIEKLPVQTDPATGRVHCSFNQAVTVTGRLSSTDPNLQNIPVKTHEGRLIRQAFIAPVGSVLLAADYSQIELRIMAHLSGDETLLAAFAAGRDIHTATAAEVFGVSLEQVDQQQRRHAKAINFGLIYGMSAFGLAKQMGVGRAEAQLYIDKYFLQYPGVGAYMADAVTKVKDLGYVETIFGRRLYLPGIKDRNHMVRKAAERAAINGPMQGSSSDIIKIAMQNISTAIRHENLAAKLCLQVHDELVFEVKEHDAEKLQQLVIVGMTSAATLKVPLEVSVGLGLNWGQAH